MKTSLILMTLITLASCASAPSKKILTKEYLSNNPNNDNASKIEEKLTLGENQLVAGYSVEAMLYTDSLIVARSSEKGKSNMDTNEQIEKEIKDQIALLTKDKTYFMVTLHTYALERAKFVNWQSKLKDFSGTLHDIQFFNVKGSQSIPKYTAGEDRNWHNSSIGCTTSKTDTMKSFQLYIIPQIKNNQNEDETSILSWEIQ